MKLRMNHREANPEAMQALLHLEKFMAKSGIERSLYELVKIRASQINGCAFCVDLHSRDFLKGEPPERMFLLPVWREATCYSDKERAALALTEAVTLIAQQGVPSEVYDEVRKYFDEKDTVSLIMAINTINCWNRMAITTGMFPGCMDAAKA